MGKRQNPGLLPSLKKNKGEAPGIPMINKGDRAVIILGLGDRFGHRLGQWFC